MIRITNTTTSERASFDVLRVDFFRPKGKPLGKVIVNENIQFVQVP